MTLQSQANDVRLKAQADMSIEQHNLENPGRVGCL
jgi:hypothetical protein